MSNNLFVSFEMGSTSRTACVICAAIEELGQATRLFSSLWYVRSNLTAAEAARLVWDVMQVPDRLLVIDASGHEVASFNVEPHCMERMSRRWHLELEHTAA
jgi:hypothetical protein